MKKFIAYEKAVKFYHLASRVKLPYYFRDQLLRASSSVAPNLRESAAKMQPKEQRRFYNIALASLRESQTILELHDCKNSEIWTISDELGALIWKLIKSRE